MNVRIVRYKPFQRNTMQGFVDIEVESAIIIPGCIHHSKGGKDWVNVPSKKEKDDKYYDLVKFPNKDTYWSFQNSCKQALTEYMSQNREHGAQDDIPF